MWQFASKVPRIDKLTRLLDVFSSLFCYRVSFYANKPHRLLKSQQPSFSALGDIRLSRGWHYRAWSCFCICHRFSHRRHSYLFSHARAEGPALVRLLSVSVWCSALIYDWVRFAVEDQPSQLVRVLNMTVALIISTGTLTAFVAASNLCKGVPFWIALQPFFYLSAHHSA